MEKKNKVYWIFKGFIGFYLDGFLVIIYFCFYRVSDIRFFGLKKKKLMMMVVYILKFFFFYILY